MGVPPGVREHRQVVLRRLFEMFEGNDPDAEVARLKSEDAGF